MRLLLGLTLATNLVAQADRVLKTDAVPTTLFFSADGKTLSARCQDNSQRSWDLATGKQTRLRKIPARTRLIAADTVAEAADGNKVRLWDLSAERQMELREQALMDRAALSADGKWLATSSAKERSVRLWNPATGEQRRTMPDGIGGVAQLTFSPDGGLVVSSNYDNDVRVWRTGSGELVKKIEDLTGAMFAVEFSPNGKQILMAGLDETVYIWDAQSFRLLKKLKGQGETISAMAISPDGKTLVTGGFDVLAEANPVKVVFWDLTSGKIVRTVPGPHRITSLAFSPDGKWVAMSAKEKEISLWKL
jgi:WD40 repeat protein